MRPHYAGFDIGGTKTLLLVVDGEGNVLLERKTARPRGPEETVDQLSEMIDSVPADVAPRIDAVGVGIAGAISRSGSVQWSPNIPELVDFPLRNLLSERLNMAVVVDNDATAATWAEHQLGAGRGCQDLLYVALGTGVGTGFVLNGSIYRGANGFAGEAGHMVIDRHGDQHISGVRGPWEMYASGNGLGALARRWSAEGRLDFVDNAVTDRADIRGEHVSAAIAAGDGQAGDLLEEFATDVAVGLTNLIYVLDPQLIVLGGGLVEMGEPLRAKVADQVGHQLIGSAHRPDVAVVLAELGARSAALGAAMLASQAS